MHEHTHVMRAACLATAAASLLFTPMLLAQQPPAAQGAAPPAAAPAGPLAPEKFKAIQVLTDVPADQLPNTMRYFTAALGVTCATCHQIDATTGVADYSADTRTKTTARNMIRMVLAVNSGDTGIKITCGTCHQGHQRPAGLQPATALSADDILAANLDQANTALRALQPPPAAPAGGAAGGRGGGAPGGPGGAPGAAPGGGGGGRGGQPGPPVADVLKKFSDALGAPTAPIQARVLVGTLTTRTADAWVFSVTQKGAMYLQTVQSSPAPRTLAYDGSAAWSKVGDKVGGANAGGFSLDSLLRMTDAQFAADIQTKYPGLVSTKRAQMTLLPGSTPVDVNILTSTNGPTRDQFYFDANSGLLLRHVNTITTPLNGSLVETVDFSNYRAEGGVMMPHKVVRNNWNTLDTYTVSRVTLNGAVDDASFKKPM